MIRADQRTMKYVIKETCKYFEEMFEREKGEATTTKNMGER